MQGFESRFALSLLDVDADLGQGIPRAEYEEARRRAAVRVLELDAPTWNPSEVAATSGAARPALFVIDGLLIRRVAVASRMAASELLGAGDIVRPWDEDGDYEPLVIAVDWLVLKRARLALLDDELVRRLARWPTVADKLMQRTAARARHLALQTAATRSPRTHARLLLMFWLLAERWGTVTPEGVMVKLPLTHKTLATLVGNRRPSVTIALQRLARSELLIRQSSNRWLLTNEAIESLRQADRLSLLAGAEPPG